MRIYKVQWNLVNNNLADWFEVHNRVKQGCILSLSLFSINDLVHDINLLGLGIPCGDSKIPTLLFADDVVILSENEQDLWKLLNIATLWMVLYMGDLNKS